ncbi:pirin family protein [Psychroserpens sp.]|uniref:pirin family protein n=1 Tax=Psychroserpens sp. TaxID=2020870 RepID=UPI001B13E070|nr:pirin family protein [Psychroserpens sp.]MBO6606607.1 pirin family protein [Psychroserpens sp.]MBO6632523.1 pirin family protein [Psychroserpens sp.]MBO6653311.1 pirin family protein [Psychroserpens sp.]MBO6680662.1 pirin family protein [Psychroserpens sp.]MBO6750380.1 pirin family protein [Psychroserpens sp.]
MKTIVHKADTRGFANHGWLKSHHTFSFASYQNPERMNFGALRVLNDDVVQPKMGFGTHPHQNMEIISIPLQGALSHKDSMGNKRAIEVGEVQVMSAGTGLTHSEFNDSKTDEVNFLQLWILPEEMSVKPNYEQRQFSTEGKRNQLQTVVAPKDKLEGDALPISQQAYIYRTVLDAEKTIETNVKSKGNGMYVFVVDGNIEVADQDLNKRDAIGISDIDPITITAKNNAELVIIEVPMN